MPVVALLTAAVWFLLRPPAAGPAEIVAAAFLAAYGLTPGARLMALGAGALDHPEERRSHLLPTPRLGGVAVIAAFLLVLGRRALADHELLAIVLAALALMTAGAIDDTRGLQARFPVHRPLHRLVAGSGPCPGADEAQGRWISLPLSAAFSSAEVDRVIGEVTACLSSRS